MDPESINAKVGLAATITQILVEGWSSSIDQDQALAERLLHEALEHDANHPMARAMMGLLRRVQNRLSEAQAEIEMAIGFDRNNELALKQLGQILLFQGEPLAAIPHLDKAIRLNPRGPNLWSIQWPLGQCRLLLGHVDAAVQLIRKACAAISRRPGRLLPKRSGSSPKSTLWRGTARLLPGLPIRSIGRFATRRSMPDYAAPVSQTNNPETAP